MTTESEENGDKSEWSRSRLLVDWAKAFERAGGRPAELQAQIERPGLIRDALAVQRGEATITLLKKPVPPPVFPTWLTGERGVHQTFQAYFDGLERNDRRVLPYVQRLFQCVELGKERRRVEYIRVKVRDLGFSKDTYFAVICARILELGHELCEPEDGLVIRLSHSDPLSDKWFILAMKAVQRGIRYLDILCVEQSGLSTRCGDTLNKWRPEHEIVFVRGRSVPAGK